VQEFKVSSRYAKSIIDLAKEQNVLEKVFEDMKQFLAMYNTSREFRMMIQSPVIPSHKKKSVFKLLFTNQASLIITKFFELVIDKKREDLLPSIAQSYIDQYYVLIQYQEAELITASPVDESLMNDVKTFLLGKGFQNVHIKSKVNPELLGGFVVNVAGNQFDASVKSHLQNLKTQLSINPYVPKY
jgi:F-type H+-transporting ATPase subunit delta